jgi:hypothetical protein
MLRTALRRSGTPDVRTVWFIKPNWTEGAAPFVRYDEFGLPSSYAPWVPDPAVLLLLRERGQKQRPSISVFAWDQTAAFEHSHPPSFLVVDMRKLHARHVSWSVWTLHAND